MDSDKIQLANCDAFKIEKLARFKGKCQPTMVFCNVSRMWNNRCQNFSKLYQFSLAWKNCWCIIWRQYSSPIKYNPKSTRVDWTFHRSKDWTCLLWVWWATSFWTRWNRPSKSCSRSSYSLVFMHEFLLNSNIL